jgi:hypothetical protein
MRRITHMFVWALDGRRIGPIGQNLLRSINGEETVRGKIYTHRDRTLREEGGGREGGRKGRSGGDKYIEEEMWGAGRGMNRERIDGIVLAYT